MPEMKVWADTKGLAQCNSCNAPIVWYQLVASGAKMPFDGDPPFIRTIEDDSGRSIGVIELGAEHRSHFATCPQAKQWRRPR